MSAEQPSTREYWSGSKKQNLNQARTTLKDYLQAVPTCNQMTHTITKNVSTTSSFVSPPDPDLHPR